MSPSLLFTSRRIRGVTIAAVAAATLVAVIPPASSAAAGPGGALVRTQASGVNFAETRSRAGAFLPMMPASLPARVGVEAVGTVTAVGEGVDPALVGTRVLATNGNGTHAEYFTVAVRAMTTVPDGVSANDAVAVGVQGATALALLEAATLTGTENVLVEAAGGGVGGYLVQLAREFGAVRVVATAGSPAKRDRAHEWGADAVVDHAIPPGPTRSATRWTAARSR